MEICWSSARDRTIAILATLHVGIEPAFLALLADRGAMPPAAAGWVVGAGQFGMSAGALLCWHWAPPRRAALAAALIGTGASIGIAIVSGLGAVLLLRVLLGVAMGLLLARATAGAARTHAHRAIGMILLGQQLLAAIVMVALPAMAAWWDGGIALAMLAIVPLGIGLLLLRAVDRPAAPAAAPSAAGGGEAARLMPSNLVAMASLIAVTLMVWSYIGAVGETAGVSAPAVGIAIAIASLASAPAALLASFTLPRHAPWRTALCCGSAILSPVLLPQESGLAGYGVAMALFNAGSTFALVRFSAWTMEGCADGRERRRVVLVQCLATAGGAPLGAVAMGISGLPALAMLAASCVAVAVIAPSLARSRLAASPILAMR